MSWLNISMQNTHTIREFQVVNLTWIFVRIYLIYVHPLCFQVTEKKCSRIFLSLSKALSFKRELGVLGASRLQSRRSTTWTTSNPFCSGYFEEGSLKLFAWAGLEPQSSWSQPLGLQGELPAPSLECRFYITFIYRYFSFGSTGVWTQGFTLASQASTTWAISSALIYLLFFFLRQGFTVRTGLELMIFLPQSPEC
jgi:hypothetical protein